MIKNDFSWLKSWEHSEYLSPDYYVKLLKPYVFNGKDDLTIFKDELNMVNSVPKSSIELGCGSGRGTEIFINHFKHDNLSVLDLSNQMLTFTKKKYNIKKAICSDTIDFMKTTSEKFDFVFSLWSFSHSLHQHLEKYNNINEGKLFIKSVLNKFILNNLEIDGKLFIIHFDSQSDEQTILMRQWAKKSKIYDREGKISLSLECIKESLSELEKNGNITFSINNLQGDAIIYNSEDEALETFINFHLEGIFNTMPKNKLDIIFNEILTYLNKFKLNDGKLAIRPKCYTINVQRIK